MPAFPFSHFRLAIAILALALSASGLKGQVPAPSPRGYLYVHDPSTITECEGRYYVFYTGQGIQSKSSADKVYWTPGPPVFSNAPSWTSNAVPGFTGLFWAPNVLYFNGVYHLWYAVSTFGSQVSAIGLVTSPTLNPADPSYQWTDQGPVIESTNGSSYNTIDPSFVWDGSNNLWMAFGSYWNGIYMVQLNATNGLRISSNSPTYQLAYNSSIEASYVYKRGGYYYLFANWGSCCDGVDSTYNIRMGRSTSVTGPYLDENGVNMAANGGTVFQEATGKFVGPGHVGIFSTNGTQTWTYHYYDANAFAPQYGVYGEPALAVAPLSWTSNNWPIFSNTWSALYHFQADARDDNEQYYGLLENGATVVTNGAYQHVLNLNGSNQYVWLPPGVGYGQTFVAVVNWHGGAEWQRIFDFGVNTSATVLLTPASGDNVLRCDINPGGNLQTIQWTNPLPSNVWNQVAMTFDGTQGILYLNGLPIVSNTSMTLQPFNVAPQSNTLGQSKFSTDPYFNGQYAAFRVYSWALTPQQMVAPVPEITLPANGSSYWPGEILGFSGQATDFAATPLGARNMTWQIAYTQDGVSNVVYGPVTDMASGTFAIPTNATGGGNYTVILSVTDNSDRQSTATATLVPANPPAAWSSYFPLKADANDVNGHYNGTLQNGASFTTDATRGNVLSLNGVNQYVSFPAGLSGMQTFTAWVKWNGGLDWQRIYDFGNDTNSYSVLTPEASSGNLRFNISVDSVPGEQVIDASGPVPAGVWTHVAVVMNGASVILYTNGVPVGTNLHANLVPGNLSATNIWLGRSQWPSDPYFSGELSDVRIFSYPLASNQISAPQIAINQPAQGTLYSPGAVVNYSGSANDFYDNPIPASNLTWSVNFINAGVTNLISGPWVGVTNGTYLVPGIGAAASNGYYQFVLTASDSVGRMATNSVAIYPKAAAGPTTWASFYPFTNGAQDASNLYNGTLQGGASIATDPVRGKVLSLSGSGEYVSLPQGAGAAQTVSGWVRWYGGSEWQRIFDFGQNNTNYFFLTPADGSNLVQCSITTDINIYNQELESTTAFPINKWTYVSVVMDGREGILYLNGKAVAVNNSVNLLPSDIGGANNNFGKSQYSTDPYFYGLLSDFSLNSSPLPLNQLILPIPTITLPANGARYAGGLSLNYAGTGTDYAGNALPLSSFSWSGGLNSNGTTVPAFGPVAEVTNGTYQIPTNGPYATNTYYAVTLTVTDTNGNSDSVSTEVLPETASLTVATVPAGLGVTLDGLPATNSTSVLEIAGMNHILAAPSTQTLNSTNYNFVLWSDGGAPTHDFLMPATNTLLTVSYIEPALSFSASGTGYNLSWPQWAGNLDLYTSTNLASPSAWTLVTNSPVISNNQFILTLPMTNTGQFYRLQPP